MLHSGLPCACNYAFLPWFLIPVLDLTLKLHLDLPCCLRASVTFEYGLDSVDERHWVRDAVEEQNSCFVIRIHSYSTGAGEYREFFSLYVVVLECIFGGTVAVQSPGLIIESKSILITPSLPVKLLIGH